MSKSEKTKAYIIERTAPVFNAKGYAGTSMSDMEEVTGLTKGSIYGNFKNKDAVAVAAFDYNLKQVTEAISTIMDARDTIAGKLLAYPDFYSAQFGKGRFKFGCAIANTATEADDTHPRLRARVNAGINLWHKKLVQLINEGKDKGEVKAAINSAHYAHLIINLIEGSLVMTKSTGNRQYLDTSLAHVTSLILKEITI